ncbi:BMP family lipoprotein [Aeromicrobium sp. Root495]|uniref:BMP family lipoprotein n=1 Tax=Aeromicrobium sp. Root495 TaxID=1736550 RepID=UPI0009E65EF1|nr:BMP family ABC transporter substrate-binding protein [Aeromicrobium sp. Root495]
MRRLATMTVAIATCGFVLTACGTAADDNGDEKAAAPKCETTKIEGDPQVAIAYDVGGRGDQSFNDSAYAGLEKAKGETPTLKTAEGEASQDEDEATREERLRGFADDGFNTIVGVGFAYSESVNKVAPDYPNVAFAVVDGFDPDKDQNCNVAYLTFAENEGSFLVGAAAALQSKTGKLGFVGGVNNALIQKFEAGFKAGAEAAKPGTEVTSTYIEQSDPKGFGDPAGGKSAAEGLYSDGADIVFHAAGGSGSGVFDAAVEADKEAIGVDSDQYKTASAKQREHIITSMLKRVDIATYDFIKSVEGGTPLASYNAFALKDDGVGFSTSGNFLSKDTITKVNAFRDQIIAGDVKVPEKP